MRRPTLLPVVLAAALAVAAPAACSDGSGSEGSDAAEARGALVEVHRVRAQQATALAVDADGDVLLVGERETGRLLAVDWRRGRATETGSVGPLDTRPTQRGLLGLAVSQGATVAALTAADGHIEVADVADDGALATRWRGPESADEANGGRLVALPDGSVAVGIGDLLEPDRTPDPDAPNGKVLRIDASGATTALAGGLNNPFAMAAGPDGTLWVADNAPGRRPERLLSFPAFPAGTSDPGAVPEPELVAEWTDTRVPSGLAWLTDGRLALCSYATAELRVVDADDLAELDDPDTGVLVADDCRYGVVALPGAGLAYAAEDDVVVLRPA